MHVVTALTGNIDYFIVPASDWRVTTQQYKPLCINLKYDMALGLWCKNNWNQITTTSTCCKIVISQQISTRIKRHVELFVAVMAI